LLGVNRERTTARNQSMVLAIHLFPALFHRPPPDLPWAIHSPHTALPCITSAAGSAKPSRRTSSPSPMRCSVNTGKRWTTTLTFVAVPAPTCWTTSIRAPRTGFTMVRTCPGNRPAPAQQHGTQQCTRKPRRGWHTTVPAVPGRVPCKPQYNNTHLTVHIDTSV
jgi:hypothetical protein